MPYIEKNRRIEINNGDMPKTAGELNYVITGIVIGFLGDSPNYQKYNDVLGVLTAIQFELYRRKISDYEDKKIAENGDVY